MGEDAFLAAYYGRYTQGAASYLAAKGQEYRNIFDVRFSANAGGFDFDLEAMAQTGDIAGKSIWAWAIGSLSGYTFRDLAWSPRVGLQVDLASGNTDRNSNVLGTFNPLFPNGYYFTLAGYTGYSNLIHVKPSVTLKPSSSTALMIGVAGLWRMTTADAIYTQPLVPVPGTAGQPGSYTGMYVQLRFDWAISRNLTFAVEAVHFNVGDTIIRAGGRNADYVGVQLAVAW